MVWCEGLTVMVFNVFVTSTVEAYAYVNFVKQVMDITDMTIKQRT